MGYMSRNRFGNEQMIVSLKGKKNPDFPQGYAEIGGKLYKFTVSRAKKDGVEFWLTIEKTKKIDSKGF